RYDYGVNFVQMVIEALLFFNPAVWWINRQIRLEREACCDAVAVTFSGQRARYAELLMQWSKPNQVAAMASFSTRKHASLAERVKRIVLPHHTPRIHLSLLSILGMFLLTALLLAALWKTTDTAVVLAAKILTPAQRADTIDQIDRSYGAQAVQKRPEDRVTIEGSVRAADGSALPNDFYIRILGQNSTGETSSGTRVKNGKFRHTMDDYYETLYLLVERLDFATAYVGPFDAERGETIDNIDVVLTHGFPGVIEVVDKKGDPIEGAAINGSYEVFERSWRGAQYLQDVISDEQGRIVIEKAITRPMKVDIWAKGYQYTCDIPCTLTPEKPTRLSLKRALPTTGTIVDTRTGSAVPNASIRIWRDHSSRHNYREYGTIWGTSDQEGRFGLTTLTKDHTYTFLIETPDHQYTRLKDVHMGDRNLLVQLDPKRHIRGVVLGQPPVEPVYNSHSRTWSKNGPVLKFMSGFEDEYSFHSSNTQLTEANGRFEFDISDVYGDTIEIKTGDKRARLKFGNGDVEDLVIDLRPLTERHQDSDEMRAVVLQFNPPEGIDCNDFQVTVSAVSQKDREAGHWGQWIKYTIQDNQIRLAVPTPGLISYGRGSLDPSRDKGTYIRPLWIEGKHQIPVSGDESPFMIDVPLHPAGTIYGQIHVPEQKHLTRSSQDVDIQLLALDTPDYMTSLGFNREIPFNGYWRPTDRYSIAPVPLGGTYVVVAQYQFGWIKSNPIDLKEGQSIAQCDLVFPRGVDVTGTVTSGRNQPLASVSVSLQFTTKIGNRPWSTAHHVIRTDHQGRFVFAGVNPEIKGTYLLRVESPKDYAPVTDIKIKPRQRPYVIKLKPSIR
ncbi:MAG: hypothetical protein HQ515_18235, partial [Phycisphaeraceae bacterium]|nr:hypothetical protein [Phycisphaeraceae bacterium]